MPTTVFNSICKFDILRPIFFHALSPLVSFNCSGMQLYGLAWPGMAPEAQMSHCMPHVSKLVSKRKINVRAFIRIRARIYRSSSRPT